MDVTTYNLGTAVADPIAVSSTLMAKTRCAWDYGTIVCDKGADKKCTDSTNFGSGSCCYTATIGAKATDIPASSAAIMTLGAYPATVSASAFFCMKAADTKNLGYTGVTALKAKQDASTLGYTQTIGVGSVVFTTGYCAGAKALAASAAVAALAIASM